MFDKDLVLIQGERNSGKSIFIYEFAKYFTSIGSRICFVSCSDSEDYLGKIFYTTKSLNSTEYNNKKTIQVIDELIKRDKFDYLVVDDIDFLTKDCILELIKLPVKKLFTFTEFVILNKPKELDIEPLQISSVSELLKEIRDKKINLLLDEK